MVFGGILFYRSDVHRIRKRELYEHSQCVTISSENDGKPQKANQSFSNSIVKQKERAFGHKEHIWSWTLPPCILGIYSRTNIWKSD